MPATNTLTSIFTAIANAIRGKNGLSTQYQPADMAAAITAIPSGGGDENAKFVNSTSTYTTNNFSSFIAYALQEIDLSNVDLGNRSSFDNMFRYCYGLKKCKLPQTMSAAITNAVNMFEYCSSLTEFNLPNADYSSCYNITNMFHACSSLTSLELPQNLGSGVGSSNQMCYGCSNLESFSAPGLAYIGSSAFWNCSNLLSTYLPACTTMIASNTYKNCNKIEAIILPASPPSMSRADLFSKGDGVVPASFLGFFVPDAAAVAAYVQASNWSAYANYIKTYSELPQKYKDLYNIS